MPRFEHWRQTLSEPVRSQLLKDSIFELTGAWKFFTRLAAEQTVFFHLCGYSALPLSFARHVAGVEVLGLSLAEQELLAEVAAAKSILNLRLLQAVDELRPPYATLVFMLEGGSLSRSAWQALHTKLLAQANGREEYWLFCGAPERFPWLRRVPRALRRLLRAPQSPALAGGPRLGFTASPLPSALAWDGLPAPKSHEAFALKLSPGLAGIKSIAVAQPSPGVFHGLDDAKPGRAGALLCGRRPAATDFSFLERLLRHLVQSGQPNWRPAGALRVLPGGKVQVVLQARDTSASSAALLKLPLIDYAATRMQENVRTLSRLALAEELTTEQRRLFPKSLAQGEFETQIFFLETFLPGGTHEQLPAGERAARHLQAIFSPWFEMQQRLLRRLDAEAWAGLAGGLVQRLQEWLSPAPGICVRLQRVLAHCQNTFRGRELALGLTHGDFSLKNILMDPGVPQMLGVIDWDLADFQAIPLLDVLHFFVRCDARSFREPAPAIALRLTRERSGPHTQYFEEALLRFGYRREDWPAIVIFYWLFRQRGYIGSDKNTDPKYLQRQIYDMLDLFEREV